MYTRGGKSTVEKPTLVNKPKIYKGRLGEVREARGGKSTKPFFVQKVFVQKYNLIQGIWIWGLRGHRPPIFFGFI